MHRAHLVERRNGEDQMSLQMIPCPHPTSRSSSEQGVPLIRRRDVPTQEDSIFEGVRREGEGRVRPPLQPRGRESRRTTPRYRERDLLMFPRLLNRSRPRTHITGQATRRGSKLRRKDEGRNQTVGELAEGRDAISRPFGRCEIASDTPI